MEMCTYKTRSLDEFIDHLKEKHEVYIDYELEVD